VGIVHVSAGRVAFVVAHTLLLVSCGIEKPPIFLALETEHFEFYREDTLPPACDALAADLEDTPDIILCFCPRAWLPCLAGAPRTIGSITGWTQPCFEQDWGYSVRISVER
jgi:hypothetical protein